MQKTLALVLSKQSQMCFVQPQLCLDYLDKTLETGGIYIFGKWRDTRNGPREQHCSIRLAC